MGRNLDLDCFGQGTCDFCSFGIPFRREEYSCMNILKNQPKVLDFYKSVSES